MNLSDVTDEDLIRNGLIDPSIRGRVMPFATRAEQEEFRDYERRHDGTIHTSVYGGMPDHLLTPEDRALMES